MKVECTKLPGGMLCPLDDEQAEKLTSMKAGGQYTVEIKMMRNPRFHRKAFAFLKYCFSHWDINESFKDEAAQFESFRKQLTIISGYYNEVFDINGGLRLEAKSISCGNMDAEEFRAWYNASIQAAMVHIFKTDSDEAIYNKLASFF